MLNVERVKKAFGTAVVLDGVNLVVNPGEVVSILGSSGSGKSTLIRCINGLESSTGAHHGRRFRRLRGPGAHRGAQALRARCSSSSTFIRT